MVRNIFLEREKVFCWRGKSALLGEYKVLQKIEKSVFVPEEKSVLSEGKKCFENWKKCLRRMIKKCFIGGGQMNFQKG